MAQPPSSTNSPAPQGEAKAPAPPLAKSHGRGGAGNINTKPSSTITTSDLATPTIKGATYTTGRGGSGNMASANPSNPSEMRAAQDVDTPLHHSKEMQGTYHWGRGGEGNMTTIGKNGATKDTRAEKMDKLSGAGAKEVVKEKLGKQERPGMNSRNGSGTGAAGKKERTFSSGSEGGAGARRSSFNAAISRGKEMLGLKKPATPVNGEQQSANSNKIPEEKEKEERSGNNNDESAISD